MAHTNVRPFRFCFRSWASPESEVRTILKLVSSYRFKLHLKKKIHKISNPCTTPLQIASDLWIRFGTRFSGSSIDESLPVKQTKQIEKWIQSISRLPSNSSSITFNLLNSI